MRKVLAAAIGIILFIGIYYVFFSHAKINLSDVKSMTINNANYDMDMQKDRIVIMQIVSMYNEAQRFRKNADTTPSHMITLKLKSGKEIEINGTTQGFHYVTDGREHYKVSSAGLSIYLRNEVYLNSKAEN